MQVEKALDQSHTQAVDDDRDEDTANNKLNVPRRDEGDNHYERCLSREESAKEKHHRISDLFLLVYRGQIPKSTSIISNVHTSSNAGR